MNRTKVTQLQPIELNPQGVWRRMEGPLTGYRLKMNMPYIRRVGYTEASEVPQATIRSAGYEGAITLNNGTVTYLYR